LGSYYRHNHREQNPDNNLGFDEDFAPRGDLSSNFDSDRNGEVFNRLIQTGRVNRIFVDEVIKKHFCLKWKNQDSDQKVAAVLRSLRPLKNHHDHFHLRLTCPPTSPRCIEQEPPPVGTGC
jgi:penicillin-insensitive murein endopeptidase